MIEPRPQTPTDPTEDLISGDRDPLDRIAEEFADRCRRGESPSIAEYEARFPGEAEKVRKLLGAVAMMEQLRRGSDQARRAPERIGEYRVLRELGRGGMGVVYEAFQESLWRHVAVKMIHHVHLDARRLQRFQREAQAVARLHHTNIVPIFGVGDHDGLPYFVMQYIRGEGLDARLKSWRDGAAPAGPDRWRSAARIGREAAEALHHAHEQGVLHRDVKPANLLIDEQGLTWVTDFGLAKLTDREDLTNSGDVIGTLRYLAPEALRGESDRRSDVYSLGLTLYELLTLNAPFGEVSPSELLRRVSDGTPTLPRRLEPEIPADLETIVLKSIAREPGHRYQTAGELAEDLGRFLEDRPIRARPVTPFERAWRWSRRNRTVAALAAAAAGSLLLAIVVGALGYASTVRALDRESERRGEAERAVALSLEVFGDLFEKLAPGHSFAPPPIGQRRPRGPAGVGGPRPGGGPGGFGDGPGGPGGPGGPPPDTSGPGGPGGRRGGPLSQTPEEKVVLLQSVLSFYDRFARQNAQNPRLRREAAWAYRKTGTLAHFLGRSDEADQANARAIAMLESLIEEYPADHESRLKLAWTYVTVDPWEAAPAALGAIERKLRRALALLGGPSPVPADPADELSRRHARVQALAKLGVTTQRLGQDEAAEVLFREAIELAGTLLDGPAEPAGARLDRMGIREALARQLARRGRADETRVQLDAIVEDARVADSQSWMARPAADRLWGAAEVSESLGDADRAAELNQLATRLGGSRDGRGGGRPRDAGPPRGP